ncbi:hypothetical protein PSHT_03865 [Puccinia striiformis]|uniref:Uncharacterized protein n=1 Tax=Puccinia striiformis TaxID=27350 RepID=A0A2S4WEI0_9BASI|nr:hypothetical protein PSHT_03865 [Puccinia striiformis]
MRLHYSCPLLLLQLFIIRELYAAVLPTIPENPVLCAPESVLLKTADAVLDKVVDPLREGNRKLLTFLDKHAIDEMLS